MDPDLEALRAGEVDHIGVPLWLATKAYERAMFDGVRALGFDDVTVADSDLLPYVEIGGTRLSRIAERRGTTKQAAHEAIHGLVRRGYLLLEPDPKDRRAKRVRHTAKGVALLRALQQVKRALHAGIADRIGAVELSRLEQTLHTLRRHLEGGADAG